MSVSAMSEPFDHLLEQYARLVIAVGVGLRPGQELVVIAVLVLVGRDR